MPQSANGSAPPRPATDASSTCAPVRTGWADACLAVGKTGRWVVPTRVGCRSAREAAASPAHSRHGFSAEGTRAEAPCPPCDPQSMPPPRAATRLCMAPRPAISKPMPQLGVPCPDALRHHGSTTLPWPRNVAGSPTDNSHLLFRDAGSHGSDRTVKSAHSKVSKRQSRNFPFSPIATPKGRAILWFRPQTGMVYPVVEEQSHGLSGGSGSGKPLQGDRRLRDANRVGHGK